MEYSQEAKERFFAHMDSLDVSEEEFDNSTQRLEDLANKRRKIDHRPRSDKPGVGKAATLSRSDKPTLKKATTLPSKPTVQQNGQPAPLTRASTDITTTRKLIPVSGYTRSVKSDLPTVEPFRRASKVRTKEVEYGAGQNDVGLLFEGLSFFFIPNNDVHPVRKRRIQSAIAQGAKWIRNLQTPLTHIIVDPDLTAHDVVKFLNGAVDLTRVTVVKDKWLIESLSYKTVRDVGQGRFQLQGASEIFPKRELPTKETIKPVQTLEAASQTEEQPPIASKDELAAILHEMQSTKQFPFDDELDLQDYISFEATDQTVPRENRGFSCMEPHIGQEENPNSRTIEILQKMATYYDRTGDNWRTLAYRKTMAALRKQPVLVSTAKQAQSIKGIGAKLADKIEEIVTTDRLRRLDSILADPNDQLLQFFTGIYGVGVQQAKLWISQGYQCLDDLRSRAKLTFNQQIGVDHYDDFQRRIPRDEVAQHGRIVAMALKEVNQGLEGIIGGSYRRGNKDSGDIDVIITHPTADLAQLRAWVFDDVVPHLFEVGFMKCALATSRSRGKAVKSPDSTRKKGDIATPDSSDSGSKFHGASALTAESPWRRIDLLLTPYTEVGAALIYFTGNDIFNRSMRLLASRKGMRLNQRGLYKDVIRQKDRTKVTDGKLVEGQSEKKIFEILGVPWRPPHERKC